MLASKVLDGTIRFNSFLSQNYKRVIQESAGAADRRLFSVGGYKGMKLFFSGGQNPPPQCQGQKRKHQFKSRLNIWVTLKSASRISYAGLSSPA